MNCCPNCFTDSYLKNFIIGESTEKGNCSYCKSNETALINPNKLFDRFEPLINLYKKAKKGKSLDELLKSDWEVFSIPGKRTQQKLLKTIIEDRALFSTKYQPKYLKEQKNIEKWGEFKEELKHTNRFFPKKAPEKEELRNLANLIGMKILRGEQNFYRARINTTDKLYEISEMGKPPSCSATYGRANPIGISYLYVASKTETAISEIRGYKGEIVTVAEFQMNDNLELVDLRNPLRTISPFQLNDDDELLMIYKNMPFFVSLGKELSKPVVPKVANLEYLSSQYLCESFKELGFDGIIYMSSVSDGYNYVIFNDNKLKPVSKTEYEITEEITRYREKY